jgi:hypothetical protein
MTHKQRTFWFLVVCVVVLVVTVWLVGCRRSSDSLSERGHSATGSYPQARLTATTATGWPDRRRVAIFTLTKQATSENPWGWVDPFAADPDAMVRDLIAFAKAADCQICVWWAREGERNPHDISYEGTPWNHSQFPIEKLKSWDDQIRAAGMIPGGTIRPQLFLYGVPPVRWHDANKPPDSQIHTDDPFAVLAAKIAYARHTYGWRAFYIDSPENKPNADGSSANPWLLDGSIYARLEALFPDCIFFPERIGDNADSLERTFPLLYRTREYNGRPSLKHRNVIVMPGNETPNALWRAEVKRRLGEGSLLFYDANDPNAAWNKWTGDIYERTRR